MQGKGRAAIVFISLSQTLNLFFSIGVYLYIIRIIITGINCQFSIVLSVIDPLHPYKWVIFLILLVVSLILGPITLWFFNFKRAKLWSRIMWLLVLVVALITLALFIYTMRKDSTIG